MGIVDALADSKGLLAEEVSRCCGLQGHRTCARKTCVQSFAWSFRSAARVAVGQALYCPHRLAPGRGCTKERERVIG